MNKKIAVVLGRVFYKSSDPAKVFTAKHLWVSQK